MQLHPETSISAAALAAGQRALVADAAWASLTGSLSGGVVLVAFALELGADPRSIGLLGAIPFIAQATQLPAIYLVERFRLRQLIGVPLLTVARLVILALACLPLLPSGGSRLAWLIAAQAAISVLGSVAACAINSWFHQLLPPADLGAVFSKRLLWATGLACVATLGVGLLVDHPPFGNRMTSYAIVFVGAGLCGLMSSFYLTRCPEPVMEVGGPVWPLKEILRAPFVDRNFRRLLLTLGGWGFASNLVAPFLAVYMMRQLGYGLGTVTAMWASSQLANAATLLSWGRISDRQSNQSVLEVAFPVYFACTLGFAFVPTGSLVTYQLAMLFVLHIVMGAAGGGIGLATGNLSMKLAPRGRGTAYLAATGLVSSVAGGAAPLVGGALAQWFSERELSFVFRWVSPNDTHEVSVLQFAHWEFLFAISAMLGLYVMHAVSRIREGNEVSERRVIQEIGLEALRTVNQLSSIGGVLGSLFPFGRLSDRRRRRTRVEHPPYSGSSPTPRQ